MKKIIIAFTLLLSTNIFSQWESKGIFMANQTIDDFDSYISFRPSNILTPLYIISLNNFDYSLFENNEAVFVLIDNIFELGYINKDNDSNYIAFYDNGNIITSFFQRKNQLEFCITKISDDSGYYWKDSISATGFSSSYNQCKKFLIQNDMW